MRTFISRLFLIVAGLCVTGFAPNQSGLRVQVVDTNGVPVRDAVITVHPEGGSAGAAVNFPWAMEMGQRDLAFVPGTLIVPVGKSVRFPNYDKVRHSIYSFSKIAKIDIALYGRDQTRSFTFAKAGAVSLGCKIHDTMRGRIKVVDTPFAAQSNVNGLVRLDRLPMGKATLKVWHQDQRAPNGETAQMIDVGAGAAQTKVIKIGLRAAR